MTSNVTTPPFNNPSFHPSWLIQKKRDGKELKKEELREFIQGLSTGVVADYQASAFLMAVYFRGMSLNETVALTEAMLESGDRYHLASIPGFKVDKHSTGGVGDKVSLILAPLAAACGIKVPMMAGRGLGHTGGTVDKLEAIPGFTTQLSQSRFYEILSEVGCVICGQTDAIAPADKKLYALRDVTATVECIPLIVASILSKKLAEGTDALIMDVKIGNGAFMKTKEQARKLAKMIIQVAKKMNLPCRAILSSMDQPLGYAVGNAIEIRECIEILRNDKKDSLCSTELKELTLHLCGQMLCVAKKVKNLNEGRKLAQSKLLDGSAWKIFQDLVVAQGGDVSYINQPEKIELAPVQTVWKAKRRGFISKMNTEELGRILIDLGGGRTKAGEKIDPHVGFVFHKKLGSKVQSGEPLATVYSQSHTDVILLEQKFQQAIEISGTRKPVPKLIFEQLS